MPSCGTAKRFISMGEIEAMTTRPVREIITRDRPLVGRAGDTVRTAAEEMAEHGCRSILVCDGGKLRGSSPNGTCWCGSSPPGGTPPGPKLAEVMTREPDTIEGSQPVVEAVRRMDEGGYHHLPVLEDNRLLGVIALCDVPIEVMARLGPELEQRHRLAERLW
jgi:CBS domain-containing protein